MSQAKIVSTPTSLDNSLKLFYSNHFHDPTLYCSIVGVLQYILSSIEWIFHLESINFANICNVRLSTIGLQSSELFATSKLLPAMVSSLPQFFSYFKSIHECQLGWLQIIATPLVVILFFLGLISFQGALKNSTLLPNLILKPNIMPLPIA